ncbi:endonuclease/exonuclease/phosphatase family protein [Streptomyces sp. RFCAC02]|uniref:endonuclease/exonuclease/phosphatase family protein n=1 Tax=Streptomyces sp. RFCAC02 TaxID=2499143 RepID=UPI00101FC6F6|nr:endonuclease/exonuclease/phosphatase family protein [Streptomyces sp. RFCAC02]
MIALAPPRALSPLTALATLVAAETLRVAGTGAWTGAGALVPLLVCAVAALGGPLVWWLGSRAALPVALTAAAVARLAVQVPAARVPAVTAVAAGVAVAALLLTVRRLDPARAARAVALGAGADLALRLPSAGLGPVWSGGVTGWTVALLSAAALAGGAELLRRRPPAAPERPVGVLGTALVGPALALYGAFLASPALLAARGGLAWDTAGLWLATGTVLAMAALARPLPAWERLASPAALLVATAVFLLVPTWPAAPAALVALTALPLVLRGALGIALPAADRLGPWGAQAAAGALAALGYTVLVLPHALGLLPALLPLLAVAGLGWAALRGAAGGPLGGTFRTVVLAAVLLAVPPLAGALRGTVDAPPTDTAGGMYRLLTWNVHQAVDRDGQVDPRAVLTVLEDARADVVVLQEVPRGTAAAGGLDLRTWLERRLGATGVWAPAGDRTTGTLLLTALPVVAADTGTLPGGERSHAVVDVRLAEGETARVVTAHTDGDTEQMAALVRALGDDPHAVLAGDLNAEPGSAAVEALLAAGLHSAQDGDQDLAGRDTAVDPDRRVDWVFGGRDVAFGGVRLDRTDASDHLPLSVTVFLD